MNRKTHTLYDTAERKGLWISGKAKPETLRKRGAISAWFLDIDTHAASKGFFNRRAAEIGGLSQ